MRIRSVIDVEKGLSKVWSSSCHIYGYDKVYASIVLDRRRLSCLKDMPAMALVASNDEARHSQVMFTTDLQDE